MLTTDREFDKTKFLKALSDKTAFNVGTSEPGEANVSVGYNGRGRASVNISLDIELTAEEADELLFNSK